MNKRALLFLGAGVLCATAVVLLAKQYISSGRGGQEEGPGATILLAAGEIEFGSPLLLIEGETQGNVKFVPWPKDLVPHGAITDAKSFKERKLVSWASFVRHEPVLESQVIEESRFVPDDMTLVRARVDPKDVEAGLIKAGMSVDVIINFEEFMRCAQIYSVGELKYKEREAAPKKQEKTPDYVYLLIRQDQKLDFLKATERAKQNLLPSRYPCEGGPMLTSEIPVAESQDAAAMLARGRELMSQGDFAGAVEALNKLLEEHPEVAELAASAEQARRTSHRVLAGMLYSEAQGALIEGDVARCLQLLERIGREHSAAEEILAKAEELRETAEGERRDRSYLALLEEIERNLAGGNLPAAAPLLEKVQTEFEDYTPRAAGVAEPQEALKGFGALLARKQNEFNSMKRVFEFYIEKEDYARASGKLREMEQQFPEHPFAEEARKKLPDQGSSG